MPRRKDVRKANEILAARENKRIDFVRLSLVRLESDEFREYVVSKHPDYGPLFSFIQPPEVRVAMRGSSRCCTSSTCRSRSA